MTYNNFLFLTVVLVFVACDTQVNFMSVQVANDSAMAKKIAKGELTLHPNEGLSFYKEKLFSGSAVEHNENGILLESIDYYDGKKDGLFRKWFENEQLSFEANYTNGRLNGLSRTWWKDGTLRSESYYENGVVDGLQKQYYRSGALFKERNLENGKEKGLQRSWRENGKIYNNYEAKEGRIFGLKRSNLCYELQDEIILFNNN